MVQETQSLWVSAVAQFAGVSAESLALESGTSADSVSLGSIIEGWSEPVLIERSDRTYQIFHRLDSTTDIIQ